MELGGEKLQLFSGGERSAFVGLVAIDEFRIRPLRPISRALIELVGESAHGDRDGDVLWGERGKLVFPIETSGSASRATRVRSKVMQSCCGFL